MTFDPKQCRVLLVGKLLARLEPFLKSKGYARTEAEESGLKSVELLTSGSYHLVLLEVNLRDIELRDFFQEARGKQRDASFILMAPPSDAEMVVSALVLGADAYVPLPPDEEELFEVLERHGMAAMQRKSSNPDGQPGVSEKVQKLEEELAHARAQLSDLEEQNKLFEAETERLNKVLEATKKEAEAAKKEAASKSSAQEVPPGHKIVAIAVLEELEGKATFIEFLESENDEIKRERDSLLEKLRESGLGDELAGGDADFDEPTGAVHIDDESLMRGVPGAEASDDIMFADDDDDDDNINIDDGASDIVAVENGVAGGDADDDDMLVVEEDSEEESEEFDLAALEEMVAKRPTAAPVAAAAPAVKSGPAPMPLPKYVPPPTADSNDDSGEGDDFEDVNTDALLRLAEEASSSDGPSAADLEELLAAIDDD